MDGRAARRVLLFWRLNVVIYLPFFAFPATDLLEADRGIGATVVAALALLAFIGTYLRAAWAGLGPAGEGDRWRSLLVCGVIAVVAAPVLGLAWANLLTYLAFLAGGTVRRPALVIGVVAGAATWAGVLALAADGPWWGAVYVVFTGVFGAAIAWLHRTCDELDRTRADAARLAVADERLRFARDLHDLLGHSLSVIALKSELAGRLAASDPARTASELRDIETVTRQALAEVRSAVTGYRAQAGLDGELERARETLAAAGVAVRVEGPDADLPADVEELFAWTVREAATNVVRHAAARHCTIRVRSGDDGADLEVVDDGVGRDGEPGGSGLAGLAERAASAHGRLETADRPGGGFRVALEVPR